MELTTVDVILVFVGIWLISKLLRIWAIASVMNDIPIQLIFPLRLEYTRDQWFAWDKEHEFLGQARTKEELINRLSKELDFPKDSFTVISESPIKQPNP